MKNRPAFLALTAIFFVAAFAFFAAAKNVNADEVVTGDSVETKQEQVEETGTITGQVVLPSKIPDWFNGGEMSLEKAVLLIEGMYRGPRMNRPKNYREMSTEERKAWFKEYKETEAYKEFEIKNREAYENRPVSKFPIAADGTFTVKGLQLARYNVIPVIPHPAAKGKELESQSFGSAFRQIVLDKKRKSFNVGKMKLKINNVVMPGDVAPSWAAKKYGGESIQSSDFRGKYLIVDFWATWCIPCIAEIPNLEKIYEEFGGDRLEIVGLSIDDNLDVPSKFIDKRPIPYHQGYLGPMSDDETVTQAFGIKSVPSIWLIGPDGRVIARDLVGKKIDIAVRSALKQSAEAK